MNVARQSRTTVALLGAVVLLLLAILALQVHIALQSRRPRSSVWRLEDPRRASSAPVRVTAAPRPPAPMHPDDFWDRFGCIEHIQQQVDRMFDEAFADTPRQAAGSVSNAVPGDSFSASMAHMREMRERLDSLFARAFDDMEHFGFQPGFDDGWAELAVTPALDLRDDGESYVVTAYLPDVEKSSLEVTLSGAVLTIVADLRDTAGSDSNATARLTRASRFERRLRLPSAPAHDKEPRATCQDGVLRIVVPKAQPSEPEEKRIVIM
jgi:HSP20 family protein